MSYENTGRLTPNKYKQTEKQPDMKGAITLERSLLKQLLSETDEDGIVIRLSAWNRSGQYGDFISIAYDSYKPKPKEEPTRRAQKEDDDESDVPF